MYDLSCKIIDDQLIKQNKNLRFFSFFHLHIFSITILALEALKKKFTGKLENRLRSFPSSIISASVSGLLADFDENSSTDFAPSGVSCSLTDGELLLTFGKADILLYMGLVGLVIIFVVLVVVVLVAVVVLVVVVVLLVVTVV